MNYKIQRPPLSKTFYLPTSEELLLLKEGNIVKLIFTLLDGTNGERMWVIITKMNSMEEWKGVLDNDPYGELLAKEVKSGSKIVFHPLDIIQIFNEDMPVKTKNI